MYVFQGFMSVQGWSLQLKTTCRGRVSGKFYTILVNSLQKHLLLASFNIMLSIKNQQSINLISFTWLLTFCYFLFCLFPGNISLKPTLNWLLSGIPEVRFSSLYTHFPPRGTYSHNLQTLKIKNYATYLVKIRIFIKANIPFFKFSVCYLCCDKKNSR